MPQDKTSGSAANDFGRRTARYIAAAIGAKVLSAASNEVEYEGQRTVIKCGKKDTTSVGVTYKMQEKLNTVLAAFENEQGDFEILSLPIEVFAAHQRPTRSQGSAAGKVGIVSKTVFVQSGKFISKVSAPTGAA